ncbi:MAG: 50S ribosomal protein L24 [bacterium]|nr:50S ribosomal protein L24 [bacterium]
MKIKKGDNIIVIAGKDRGKTGKVSKALPASFAVVIPGLNIKKVHERPKKSGQKGQIVEKSLPIHVSNVMIVDPKTNKGTRIGKKKSGDGYVRIARRSGAVID